MGGGCGVLVGQKFKNIQLLPNGWTNSHQIWHKCADSSGNGHGLKQLAPREPRVHLGGFKGSTIQASG